MSEQLQVSTATSDSETKPTTSSAFSTKEILSRSIRKTKRSVPFSPQKKAETIGALAKKFNLCMLFYITSKEEKRTNSVKRKRNGLRFLYKYQILHIQLAQEGILSTLEWTAVKRSKAKTMSTLKITWVY